MCIEQALTHFPYDEVGKKYRLLTRLSTLILAYVCHDTRILNFCLILQNADIVS